MWVLASKGVFSPLLDVYFQIAFIDPGYLNSGKV